MENIIQDEYREIIALNTLIHNRPIILFGCGNLGKYAIQVFDKIGIHIECFMDNDKEKIHKNYMDKEILSPKEAKSKYPNAMVCICIFNQLREMKVKEQLWGLEYHDFIDKDLILHLYTKLHIKPMAYKIHGSEVSLNTSLAVIITEKCSLKCKYCAHFIPYRKKTDHFDKFEIINEIKAAADIIDEIKSLSIYGGEGMLHPDFEEICYNIKDINNIKSIVLLTNGTVIPSKNLMETISNNKKFVISISDYEVNKSKRTTIEKLCEEYNVCITYSTHDSWHKPFKLEKHDRSESENRAVYIGCNAPETCPMIINGKLYKCGISVVGERMGWIPESREDTIDLLDKKTSMEEKKELLKEFILSDGPLKACDYCVMKQGDKIPVAEQLTAGSHDIAEIFN